MSKAIELLEKVHRLISVESVEEMIRNAEIRGGAQDSVIFALTHLDQALAILKEQSPALNSCPFPPCKGEGRLQRNAGIYYIYCKNCGRHTDSFKTEANAVEAWNKINKPEQPSAGEFTKLARKAIVCLSLAEADEKGNIKDEKGVESSIEILFRACDRIDQQAAQLKAKDELLFAYESVRAPKQPPAGDFTKKMRETHKEVYSHRPCQYTTDIYDLCDIIDRLESKEQPSAGELAKRLRAGIRLRDNRDKCGDPVEVIIDIKLINEACTRLDRSLASRKELLTACEAVWNDTKGLSPSDYVKLETFKMIEAAIKSNKETRGEKERKL